MLHTQGCTPLPGMSSCTPTCLAAVAGSASRVWRAVLLLAPAAQSQTPRSHNDQSSRCSAPNLTRPQVEPREAFVLPWRVLTEAARCFVQPPAAPAGGSTPARVASLAPPAATPTTRERAAGRAGLLLADGHLTQRVHMLLPAVCMLAAAMRSTAGTLSPHAHAHPTLLQPWLGTARCAAPRCPPPPACPTAACRRRRRRPRPRSRS